MEEAPLINSEKINKHQKVIVNNHRCFRFHNILIVIIFLIQVFTTTYLMLLGKYAQDLDLFNFNQTETDDYIHKIKIIINEVCDSFVNCSV